MVRSSLFVVMYNEQDIIIYDPFDFAQDMFINYYCLFLCGLCASVANSDLKKQSQFYRGERRARRAF